MRLFYPILIFHCVILLNAQEHPPVMAFSPEVYGAENQNWSVTQSEDQRMYFANNSCFFSKGPRWCGSSNCNAQRIATTKSY